MNTHQHLSLYNEGQLLFIYLRYQLQVYFNYKLPFHFICLVGFCKSNSLL